MSEEFLDALEGLDEEVREVRENYPPGPNSDAIKHALSSIHAGIDHLRNARDQVRGLDRDEG